MPDPPKSAPAEFSCASKTLLRQHVKARGEQCKAPNILNQRFHAPLTDVEHSVAFPALIHAQGQTATKRGQRERCVPHLHLFASYQQQSEAKWKPAQLGIGPICHKGPSYLSLYIRYPFFWAVSAYI